MAPFATETGFFRHSISSEHSADKTRPSTEDMASFVGRVGTAAVADSTATIGRISCSNLNWEHDKPTLGSASHVPQSRARFWSSTAAFITALTVFTFDSFSID